MTEVLYVGDESEHREAVLDGLDGTAFDVTVRREGAAAVRRRNGSFDCIISQTDLPETDGLWLLRRFERRRSPVSTVALLDCDPNAALRRPEAVSVDALLPTPVDPGTVRGTVERVATDRQVRRARAADEAFVSVLSDAVAAIADADSRPAVEQTVCETLAATDAWDVVWVSRFDAERERLVPERAHGLDEELLAPMAFDPDEDAPVVARQDGCVVVPFRTDGTVHGAVHLSPVDQLVRPERETLVGLAEAAAERLAAMATTDGGCDDRLQEYASVVAHELGNHLQLIESTLDLAWSEEDPDRFEKAFTLLDRVSRVATEAEVVARGHVDPDDLRPRDLGETVRAVWERLPADDGTLTVADSRPVVADHDVLELAFENLFRNSLDHGGPDVDVRVGLTDDGFYVEDTGRGIPLGEREQVFDLGYAIEGGTGVGLGVVERIVAAHGWTISLTESDAGGVRFEVGDVTFV